MMRRKLRNPVQLTLDDARPQEGRGGWRLKAGRKKGRKTTPHDRREAFAARYPQHVTLRVREGLGSLRRNKALRIVKRAILAGGHRADFRVVHFNVLGNHFHLIAEAEGAEKLGRGMQGLAVRLARGLNRVLERKGKLFEERYHARVLRTPREVRFALRYVLLNGRHHAAEKLGKYWIDPFSSAAWFDGWTEEIRGSEPWIRDLLRERCPTAPASVWLLTTGWRRWGLMGFDEMTGAVAAE